jgi:hypothetical protein
VALTSVTVSDGSLGCVRMTAAVALPEGDNRDAAGANGEATGLRRRLVNGASNGAEPTPQGDNNNEDATAANATARPRRPKGFMELLFSPLSLILGEAEPEDPQIAARLFADSLQRRFGPHCPRFELTSFRDAVSTARTMSKFLLVFLHSNIHDDALRFAKQTVCTQQFTDYVNDSDSVVAWAGCVQQVEGFGVSLSLGCAKFPFIALLTCVSRGVNVVEKITSASACAVDRLGLPD